MRKEVHFGMDQPVNHEWTFSFARGGDAALAVGPRPRASQLAFSGESPAERVGAEVGDHGGGGRVRLLELPEDGLLPQAA